MDNLNLPGNGLQITPSGQSYLTETARWGKFLAMIGFICCGFMIIAAFFLPVLMGQLPPCNTMSSSVFSAGMKVGMTVVYLILALLFFFPCFYLYKFSIKMQAAVKNISQENFDESLMNMKSMCKFYGIFTIIILSFYVLAFIVGIIRAAVR